MERLGTFGDDSDDLFTDAEMIGNSDAKNIDCCNATQIWSLWGRRQEIGWEERLRNDPSCVGLDVKP